MNIDITYRGPLASCNYDCDYCPFAKTFDDGPTRQADKLALDKLLNWVESRAGIDRIRLLFTPWGEALVRSWYREAIVKLSHMKHVDKVVIQTNLSTLTLWLAEADNKKVALWTTYHPSQVTLEKFIEASENLEQIGINYSVGIVGLKENKPFIKQLRERLPANRYLWINAYKDEADYYTAVDSQYFNEVDPWFDINAKDYDSLGKPCSAGRTSISLDGDGQVRQCNFVKKPLGNLYQQDLHQLLNQNACCPNVKCDCYIGYIHLDELNLESVYGQRIFERIPLCFEC
ncbi:MAG: STM4011 family radical SAM protein [Psychrosphaera sp.]|nr:STM4011 family radical SAM protein [Psychrosphaera sp.]